MGATGYARGEASSIGTCNRQGEGGPARSGPVYQAVSDLGVRKLVIHSKGRPGAARKQVEHRRAFRRTVRW